MKKFTVLTSVFALAACGGGSGGNFIPGSIETPDQNTGSVTRTVDSDTGLGMIDINASRIARYNQAMATVNTIENQYDINYDAQIQRTATGGTSSKSHSDTDSIDSAYENMKDIFINKNFANHTNHQILLSLALLDMNKDEILGLLDWINGLNLDDKIQDFVAKLQNQDDTVKDITNRAANIYQDFGREFNLTLRDAKFYHNSSDTNYYTFKFDDNGNITHLEERDGSMYAKNANGVFENTIKGKRYTFEHNEGGIDINVEIVYNTSDVPSDEQEIRNKLIQQVAQQYGEQELNTATTWINNAAIIHGGCGDTDICIESSNADYKERIRIETGSKTLGLKYSDFGLRFEETEFFAGDDALAGYNGDHYLYKEHGGFVGGYEDKKANPVSGTTYRGDSYVGLTRKLSDAEIDALGDHVLPPYPDNIFYKGTAVLTVNGEDNNNLTQSLVADFSKEGWYEVSVNNMPVGQWDPNNNDISFAFDAKDNQIDTDWQVRPNTHDGKIENLNIKHYGPSSDDATETVGFVQYIEDHVSDGDWTFKADITFGAKKVNE